MFSHFARLRAKTKRFPLVRHTSPESAWGEHEGGGYDPLVLNELICALARKMRTATPYEVAVHFASGQVITCTYKSRWVLLMSLLCSRGPNGQFRKGLLGQASHIQDIP